MNIDRDSFTNNTSTGNDNRWDSHTRSRAIDEFDRRFNELKLKYPELASKSLRSKMFEPTTTTAAAAQQHDHYQQHPPSQVSIDSFHFFILSFFLNICRLINIVCSL